MNLLNGKEKLTGEIILRLFEILKICAEILCRFTCRPNRRLAATHTDFTSRFTPQWPDSICHQQIFLMGTLLYKHPAGLVSVCILYFAIHNFLVTFARRCCTERSWLVKSSCWSTSCVLMFSATYSLSLTPLSSSDVLCSSLKHPLHLRISIRVMVRLLCVIRVENNINNNNKNNSSLWSREERRRKVFDNVHQRAMLK